PTLEGSGPDRVCVDRAAAVQALLNLLSNAAKYSPSEALIEVTWRPRNADEGSFPALAGLEIEGSRPGVAFCVRDQGEGVPQALRQQIFEPFFRRDPGDPQRRGMGLGLRVARGLARAHGGEVIYEEPADGGAGSVFVLELACVRLAPGSGS
ncbi:MAG: sensor histidine kinase, partial [Planctomycetota bacterium]